MGVALLCRREEEPALIAGVVEVIFHLLFWQPAALFLMLDSRACIGEGDVACKAGIRPLMFSSERKQSQLKMYYNNDYDTMIMIMIQQ